MTLNKIVVLDARTNADNNAAAIGKETDISSRNSRVKVLVIPTIEELVITKNIKEIVEKESKEQKS
ncbi:MAG: hypothetical protein JSU69_09425 [Candidatus Zixiibacteriota bacterium]|nr:MAG: hypothetical protein JSU69_09425 [candidate division Zixibacteria bacterium]